MMEAGEVKNMIDLCYQTLALADIDAVKYKDQIAKNAERILSLQRPDGQWSMRFDPKEPEVEFQTGHALWALTAAGIPRENPQVQKALDYLLNRQQIFGGWFDPLQSFENFRTPIPRNAVRRARAELLLSRRRTSRKDGTPPPRRLFRRSRFKLLEELDRVWDGASPALIHQIEIRREIERRPDPPGRRGSVRPPGQPVLRRHADRLLGDPSKLVQRTAAWSLRQIYSRHEDTPSAPLLTALILARRPHHDGAQREFSRITSPPWPGATKWSPRSTSYPPTRSSPSRMDAIRAPVAGLVLECRSRRAQPASKTPC